MGLYILTVISQLPR